MKGRAHKALATHGDPIPSATRYLGYQSMRPQQADPPTDTPALPALLRGVVRPRAVQLLRYLTIAKTTQGILASQRGLEQGLIVATQGLQGATAPPLINDRRTALVQLSLADAQVVDDRQRLQITRARLTAHFRVPVQVGHSLGHREPAHLLRPVLLVPA